MRPLISIVIPVCNDAETIEAALESCLAQTMTDIEVICVDDASADASAEIVENVARRDHRVRLLRHSTNLSALQARRTGVQAARADHLLFLDGDDELTPEAASAALQRARRTDADLVGFGVTVIGADGNSGGRYERRLQPRHRSLREREVLIGLFPIDQPADGQLWRYLFRTDLLRRAHALLPDDLVLLRVNDLPVMFLTAALATRYVSMPARLYRYHLGRGGSGHRVDSLDRARFYTSAITSIDSISDAVGALALASRDTDLVLDSYASARRWIIAYVCHQLLEKSDSDVVDDALSELWTHADVTEVAQATARFFPDSLTTLQRHVPSLDISGCSTARGGGTAAARSRAQRVALHLGRSLLRVIPGLRPLAHRARRWLRVE
ncbi:glycosyltransferase family 2 protein [Microbacterium aurum]